MKKSLTLLALAATFSLFTVGCTTMKTAFNKKDAPAKVASSEKKETPAKVASTKKKDAPAKVATSKKKEAPAKVASTKKKESPKVASSEQLNSGLAPIAAPPSSPWGGASRPYSY